MVIAPAVGNVICSNARCIVASLFESPASCGSLRGRLDLSRLRLQPAWSDRRALPGVRADAGFYRGRAIDASLGPSPAGRLLAVVLADRVAGDVSHQALLSRGVSAGRSAGCAAISLFVGRDRVRIDPARRRGELRAW